MRTAQRTKDADELCPRCGGAGRVMKDGTLGAKMRARRRAAGLTLAMVAQRVGYHKSYLSDLEQGKRRWRAELVTRLAEAYAV